MSDTKKLPIVEQTVMIRFDQNMIQAALSDYAWKLLKSQGLTDITKMNDMRWVMSEGWNISLTFTR